ncbi:MAG: hypothetical protein K8H88_15870 [Sandaracinaceae bacterium]|nr:hypothetical protein [Sandaracinaceae bacterium]
MALRPQIVVIAALGLLACTGRPTFHPGDECELNTDCSAQLVCRLGRCRIECRAMRDCPAGLECVRDEGGFGACQLPEEASCELNTDCPEPLVCRFRRCTNACQEDRDCPPGARCLADDMGGMGCRDVDAMECELNSDCAEGYVCAVDRRCREPCREDRDCRDGLHCDTRNTPSMCVPASEIPDGGIMPDATMPDSAMPTDAGTMMAVAPPTISGGSGESSCVVRADGRLWCWGQNDLGQLGLGDRMNRDRPTAAVPIPPPVRIVASGAGHTCALAADGLYCWGDNTAGQVGTGLATTPYTSPTRVPSITGNVTALAAGRHHTCAIVDGAALCWGENLVGQLGDGTSMERRAPQPVMGLSAAPVALSARTNTTCALLSDLTVECFGANDRGQLGIGSLTPASSATPRPLGLSDVVQVSLGSTHGCAMTRIGNVSCWGSNLLFQLGDNTMTEHLSPTALSLPQAALSIAAGGTHTCARLGAEVRCWGDNANGQCGQPSTTFFARTPSAVTGLGAVAELAAGDSFTCARAGGDDVRCFGLNGFGQLGNGMAGTDAFAPVGVVWP